jgi:membrane fusion protein, multidrug efflux system
MRNVILLAVAVLACAGTAGWTDDRPANQEKHAASFEPKQIELRKCPIKAVKSARLATDRPGVLAEIDLKEGDSVHEDQVVARLMDEVPKANLEVAKLVADDEVEVQYATKLNAVDTKEYEKSLAANRQHYNTIPQLDILRAKLNMEKSQLQIGKAKHEIAVNLLKAKQAEAELNTYRIMAPFDGVVTSIVKHRGEAVHQGDPILEVVNTDVVRVEGKVKEQDIWNVKVGCPVIVHLSIPDAELNVVKQAFRGKIGFVDVVANGASFETRVWAEIPNPDNILRPGLLATMTILPYSSDAAGLKTPLETGSARVARHLSQP